MKNKGYKLVYDNDAYANFFTEYIERKEKEIPKISGNGFMVFFGGAQKIVAVLVSLNHELPFTSEN